MINILVVEDDVYRTRFFIERFGCYSIKIIENAYDAIEYIKIYKYDYIFLDNDLGHGNGEGIDVVNFLYNNPGNINNRSIIITHSWNTPATKVMKNKLPNIVIAPFNTEIFFNLNLDI